MQAAVLKNTNEEVYLLPWMASAPCPWNPGYSRIVRPIPLTNKGKRAEIMIVSNKKLQLS